MRSNVLIIILRHYPRQNLDENITFTFEADPNLCLVKNKIAIHFSIELHQDYVPENGFAAKLFSTLAVEINSQRVSSNRSKGEYFLHDWLLKKG